jgi:WD40 repeat protein
MLRFMTVFVLAVVIAVGAAWLFGLNLPHFDKDKGDPNRQLVVGDVAPPETLGSGLYEKVSLARPMVNPEQTTADPVIIFGSTKEVEKMDACAQVPGQILFIGQEVPEGTAQVAGIAPLLQGRVQVALVDVGDSKHYKLFRKLEEGNVVNMDEMVALINPAKAVHAVRTAETKLRAQEAEEYATERISTAADRLFRQAKSLYAQKVIADKEMIDAELTAVKTYGDWVTKRETAKVAAIELTKEKLLLGQHYVLNKLPVRTAIIKEFKRRTGESVKELEPVLHLYAINQLTAEGALELQFKNRVKLGQKVSVEPLRESSPLRVWRAHKKEITAVAPAHHGNEMLAASGSEDGTVCLWSAKYAGPVAALPMGHPVRSLVCAPASAKQNLLIAGLSNGTIVVWDLNTLKLDGSDKPLKVIADQHNGAVTSLAFSPDGRYFASGSADGTIAMWDTTLPDSNFHLYPFDAAHGVASPHNGPVTSLHFTPQCTLVSASSDNTVRIWDLRTKGAVLVGEPMAGRGGAVATLGVSRDGGTLLFDQGKTLQFVTPDGRTIATIQNPGGSTAFETLAEFSPDASLLLTAGGVAEGRLQLWKAPADGKRGAVIRQFVTSEHSPVTSAAFFDAGGKAPLAVSGTKDGIVYLWSIPNADEVKNSRIDNVEVIQISQSADSPRSIQIGVNVPNEDQALIPGQPVTIVIE